MPKRNCKRAGSFRICRSYDPGNESHVLTAVRPGDMGVEGEAWKFHFDNRKKRDAWYKDIRGENGVRHLLLASYCEPGARCDSGIEREEMPDEA